MRCLCPRCCNVVTPCVWWKLCVFFYQLLFCVVCVDGRGYVYVCESYVVFDECDDPPPCLCSVCAYGGVVGYFCCFSFLCEFCFLYCDDVRLGAVH